MGGVVSECHGEWNCSHQVGFCFFPQSPRFVSAAERGKNSFSGSPNKTRAHFAQGTPALRWAVPSSLGNVCEKIWGQICALALCFSRISYVWFPGWPTFTTRPSQDCLLALAPVESPHLEAGDGLSSSQQIMIQEEP